MIIVGVGAPQGVPTVTMLERRLFDFTPSVKGPEFSGFKAELFDRYGADQSGAIPASAKFGGAPLFLDSLVDFRTRLSGTYRMADEHILFGHSGGGIFCAFALLSEPDAFSAYICGSPGLSWGDFELLRLEESGARRRTDLPARVFFGVGEKELLEHRLSVRGTASATMRLVGILEARRYPSLQLNARVFPGETHGSVAFINLIEGLRSVLGNSGL
jgi:hypothetical protein